MTTSLNSSRNLCPNLALLLDNRFPAFKQINKLNKLSAYFSQNKSRSTLSYLDPFNTEINKYYNQIFNLTKEFKHDHTLSLLFNNSTFPEMSLDFEK